jgi:hypothetical protein
MMDHLFPRRSWLLARLIIGTLIGAVSLWWAVRGLELSAVLQALAMASPAWVMVSLMCVITVSLVKAARWRALYGVAERRTSFWELFTVLMAAQMVNVLIPVRLGELIRTGLMKQVGQPSAVTLSTIIVEKVLDLVAAALVAVSLVTLTVAPAGLHERASSVLLIGLTLATGLILMVWLRDCLKRSLTRGLKLNRMSPVWQKHLLYGMWTMLEAFGALTNTRSLARVTLWTVSAWLLSLLAMLALFAAFGLQLPVAAAVVMMLAVSSSNIAPSPPALVGVMHLIAVVVLTQYGVAQPVAVGFGIVLNAVTVIPLIVLGSWALWLHIVPLLAWLSQRSMDEVGVG